MRNDSPFHRPQEGTSTTSRREFLWRSGGGLGGIALASLLGGEGLLDSVAGAAGADSEQEEEGRGRARPKPDFKPRAKRVIQMFMAGAASHLDLFDYKPELVKRDGQ